MSNNFLRLDVDTWINLSTGLPVERYSGINGSTRVRIYTAGDTGQGDEQYFTLDGETATQFCTWLEWCGRDAGAEIERAQASEPGWSNELIALRGHLSGLVEAADEYQSRATAPHASHSHTCCGNHYTIGHTKGCFYAAAQRDLSKRIAAARALLDSGKEVRDG